MKNTIFVIIEILIGVIPYIIAYKNISPYKLKVKDYGYMVLSIVFAYCLLYITSSNLESMAMYLIPILFIYKESRDFIKSIVLHAFICLIIIFNSSLIGTFILRFFDNVAVYTLDYYIFISIIFVCLYIISWGVGKAFNNYKHILLEGNKSKYGVLAGVALVATCFMFYVNINWNTSKDPTYLTKVNSIIFIIYCFILVFICASLIFFVYKESRIKAKQMQFEAIQEYTMNLETLYMDMRKFRHDYINILSSISAFLDEKDIYGLEKYFYKHIYPLDSAIEKKNFKLGLLKNIKIMELKGLLSAKLIRAQELDLNVNIDIVEPIENISMDIVDLIRVLGILLDNAIEAAIESDEKRVEIGIIKKKNSIIIVVLNSYKDNIPPIHQIFIEGFSTKGENRGLGLNNMKSIINQYENIVLDTSIQSKSFVQCLSIKNKLDEV